MPEVETEAETVPTVAAGAEAFVHLHTHSEFSLLDGAARIPELVACAKAMGQPAVAVTDHGVLYGAVELYTEAIAAGVKPIVGCEVYMAPRSHRDKEGRADRDPNHLVLLARDATGYSNLVALSTIAHLEGYYYKPRIDKELLAAHSEGLICLSGCVGGELPQAILSGDLDAAERVARQHAEILGPDNYFLELQDHGMTEETAVREGLLEIARRTGLPLICTNDFHYIHAADAEAHDILLCLQTGSRRVDDAERLRFHGHQFYLKRRGDGGAASPPTGRPRPTPCAVADAATGSWSWAASPPGLFAQFPRASTPTSYLVETVRARARPTLRRRIPPPRRASAWRCELGRHPARWASPRTSSSSGTSSAPPARRHRGRSRTGHRPPERGLLRAGHHRRRSRSATASSSSASSTPSAVSMPDIDIDF